MSRGRYGAILRQVDRLFRVGTVAGLTEDQLLERFVARRDEAAFEALLARHGPMVWGVCRRWLDDPSDAEDAFQATFVVLARRAGSIRRGDPVGAWLHGVARKVAARARADVERRRRRERIDPEILAKTPAVERDGYELRWALDEEIGRLPEKYRRPIVLCYLEGRTHDEAARELRWPVGTVRGRLARARDLLRTRLVRRGIATATALGVSASVGAARAAAVPPSLFEATTRAVSRIPAGPATAATTAGVVSARVAALSEGVLRTMLLSQLKPIAALATAAVVTAGAGVYAYQDTTPATGAGGTATSSAAPSSGAAAKSVIPPPAVATAKAPPQNPPPTAPTVTSAAGAPIPPSPQGNGPHVDTAPAPKPAQWNVREFLKSTRAEVEDAIKELDQEEKNLSARLNQVHWNVREFLKSTRAEVENAIKELNQEEKNLRVLLNQVHADLEALKELQRTLAQPKTSALMPNNQIPIGSDQPNPNSEPSLISDPFSQPTRVDVELPALEANPNPLQPAQPNQPLIATVAVEPQPGQPSQPLDAPQGYARPAPDPQQRLQNVEQQLNSLLQAIETLRGEIQAIKGGGTAPRPQSF
jgi:RNA polymerase sigma factor (sigma-70 family)